MRRAGIIFLLTYYVTATLAALQSGPVCGSDGRTYEENKELLLAKAGNPDLHLLYSGPCHQGPHNKIGQTEPVCGTDGNTYKNIYRLLIEAGTNPYLDVLHPGPCDHKDVRQHDQQKFPQNALVCGTDLRTYKYHDLQTTQRDKPDLEVLYPGPCGQNVIPVSRRAKPSYDVRGNNGNGIVWKGVVSKNVRRKGSETRNGLFAAANETEGEDAGNAFWGCGGPCIAVNGPCGGGGGGSVGGGGGGGGYLQWGNNWNNNAYYCQPPSQCQYPNPSQCGYPGQPPYRPPSYPSPPQCGYPGQPPCRPPNYPGYPSYPSYPSPPSPPSDYPYKPYPNQPCFPGQSYQNQQYGYAGKACCNQWLQCVYGPTCWELLGQGGAGIGSVPAKGGEAHSGKNLRIKEVTRQELNGPWPLWEVGRQGVTLIGRSDSELYKKIAYSENRRKRAAGRWYPQDSQTIGMLEVTTGRRNHGFRVKNHENNAKLLKAIARGSMGDPYLLLGSSGYGGPPGTLKYDPTERYPGRLRYDSDREVSHYPSTIEYNSGWAREPPTSGYSPPAWNSLPPSGNLQTTGSRRGILDQNTAESNSESENSYVLYGITPNLDWSYV